MKMLSDRDLDGTTKSMDSHKNRSGGYNKYLS